VGKEAPLARAFIVGNGSIVATGDRRGTLREFYAPFVAPEHQWLRRPAGIGIAVDGRAHWLPADFDGRLAEGGDTPIVDLSLVSPALGLELWIQTYVDAPLGVLVRRVQVANRSGILRDLRLLFHHDFILGFGEPHEAASRDTVSGGILHQAARRCALVNMDTCEGSGVPYWKVASRAADEAAGAEALAHGDRIHAPLEARGRVDSLAGAPLALAPGAAAMVTVWIATGATLGEARERDEAFRRAGVAASVSRTRAYWSAWLAQGTRDLFDLPEDVAALYRRSLVLLRLHQAPSGAIVSGLEAAPEAPSRTDYRWCWHRDAAIAADALGRAGYASAAQRYFEFAARSAVAAGSLPSAVETDGAPAGAGTDIASIALPLWALARHGDRTKEVELLAPLYRDLAAPAAERLAGSMDPPVQLPASHGLWNERAGFHASCAVAARAGLKGAARLAARFGDGTRAKAWSQIADQVARALIQHLYRPEWGRFARSLVMEGRTLRPDPTLDASILWPGLLEGIEAEDTRVKATVAAVRGSLWVRTGIGGIARYERDPLGSVGTDLAEVPGNPWIEATLWMGEHAIQSARRVQDLEAARTILLWCAARAEGWSLLPEQLHPYRGETTSSTPSLLAHAWLVETVVDYVERLRELTRCDRCGAPATSRADRESASRSAPAAVRVAPEL